MRARAYLILVFVTDEDDCSTQAGSQAFPDLLQVSSEDDDALSERCKQGAASLLPIDDPAELLGVPREKLVTLVMRPPGTTANSGPPIRWLKFTDALGPHGEVAEGDSIESAYDLLFPRHFFTRLSLECLPGRLLDSDTGAPGIRPACVVNEEGPEGGATQVHALPHCASGAIPCWKTDAEIFCFSGSHFIVDSGDCTPTPGTKRYITN